MKRYVCLICGYVYDESKGVPHEGIAAGTAWEDVAEDWLCPDCGAMKDDFEMIALQFSGEQIGLKSLALIHGLMAWCIPYRCCGFFLPCLQERFVR